MKHLRLVHVNPTVYRVLDEAGHHVGNLKQVKGAWKLKAIGYAEGGHVIPGGGPLTDRHNTVFIGADEQTLNRVLLSPPEDVTAPSTASAASTDEPDPPGR